MLITDSIRKHGNPIHVEKEFHIKPVRNRKDVCYYGDIFAVYEKGRRWYLVGIEIKDWKVKVGPRIAQQYVSVYGEVCEYFYLAARRFSQRLLQFPSIGLFSLEKMEVVKEPAYLYPDENLRASAIKRMKKGGLKEIVIESPYQTTLDSFL